MESWPNQTSESANFFLYSLILIQTRYKRSFSQFQTWEVYPHFGSPSKSNFSDFKYHRLHVKTLPLKIHISKTKKDIHMNSKVSGSSFLATTYIKNSQKGAKMPRPAILTLWPGWSPLQGVHGKGMTFCNGYREREGRLKIETSHSVFSLFLETL